MATLGVRPRPASLGLGLVKLGCPTGHPKGGRYFLIRKVLSDRYFLIRKVLSDRYFPIRKV